jgi:hypothetical protein
MKKSRVIVAFGIMALATGTFAFSRQTRATLSHLPDKARQMFAGAAPNAPALAATATAQRPSSPPFSPQDGDIPQYAVYRQLFRHFVFLKEKAAEKEQHAEDGSSLRTFYKRKANLDDKQAQALDRIATETDDAVTKLDEKAKKIIDDIRARYPDGKLPAGQQPPPMPEELKAMQKQRIETILAGRDRLRQALGEQEFQRFDQYVQQNIAGRMKPIDLNRPRPAFPDGLPLHVGPRKPQGKETK